MTEREKRFIDEKFTDENERLNAYKRLEDHEPLAYILGEWYFYDERYLLNKDTLIPRSDTEILVEQAIKYIPRGGEFIDLCTGSGCVAISILAHRPDLKAVAVDISPSAIEMAKKNAALNAVDDRIVFLCADLLDSNFTNLFDKRFDALTSNPPYINSSVIPTLAPEIAHEPHIALDGGEDGLAFYRRIFDLCPAILKDRSPVLMEIGYDQADALKSIFGYGEIVRDYGGQNRVFLHNRK